MAGVQTIVNPEAAFKVVSDHRTGRTDDGEILAQGQEVVEVRADAAVAFGEVVNWVAPTQTVPLSVTPMAAATANTLLAGVAQKAAAAGEIVTVVRSGFAIVDVGAETAAADSVLTVPATTTGKAEIGVALAVGNGLGVAMAAKDANNLAPAIIQIR